MDLFPDALARLKHALRVSKDGEVAEALGMTRTAFSERKKRGSFPEKELRALTQQRPDLGIDVDYVLTGKTQAAIKAMAAGVPGRLRELRGPRTPEEVAAQVGVSPEEWLAAEQGRAPDAAGLVMRAIERMEVDPKWLLSGEHQKMDDDLSYIEVVLVENYRGASDEGKALLRKMAAACAAYNLGVEKSG